MRYIESRTNADIYTYRGYTVAHTAYTVHVSRPSMITRRFATMVQAKAWIDAQA